MAIAQRVHAEAARYAADDASFEWSAKVREINETVFRNSSFRGVQLPAIHAALDGRDCVLLLPTGAGKSLTFQLPALARDGMTLVIGPLIALARDQVEGLRRLQIDAQMLSCYQPHGEREEVLASLDARVPPRLLFVTPERVVRSGRFACALSRLHARGLLQRIAVDEAHCIAAYGHDFRPDYLRFGVLRERFADVPISALTATATPMVLGEIVERLGLRDPVIFRAPLDRPNLAFEVRPKGKDAIDQLAALANSLCPLSAAPEDDGEGGEGELFPLFPEERAESDEGAAVDGGAGPAAARDDGRRARGVGIVYCFSCKEAETVADALARRGVRSSFYHAQLEVDEREAAAKALRSGRVQLLVCTCAFGMGIDLPSVRLVAHFSLPSTLDALYQEAGRAGRDGAPAQHVLFFAYADKNRIEAMVRRSALAGFDLDGGGDRNECVAALARKLAQLLAVTAYALDDAECRRVRLLRAFTEAPLARAAGAPPCCDVCARVGRPAHPPRDVRALAVAVLGLCRALHAERRTGGGFGVGVRNVSIHYLAKLAAGSRGSEVLDARHERVEGYGAAHELRQVGTVRLLQAMVIARFLSERATATAHGGVSTDLAPGPRASELDGPAATNAPFLVCLAPLAARGRPPASAVQPQPRPAAGATPAQPGRAAPAPAGGPLGGASVFAEWRRMRPDRDGAPQRPGGCAAGDGGSGGSGDARACSGDEALARRPRASGERDGSEEDERLHDDDDDEEEAAALLCTLDCELGRGAEPRPVRCGWDDDDAFQLEPLGRRGASCAPAGRRSIAFAAGDAAPDSKNASARKRPRHLSAARTKLHPRAACSTVARARNGCRSDGGGSPVGDSASDSEEGEGEEDGSEHIGGGGGRVPLRALRTANLSPCRPMMRLDGMGQLEGQLRGSSGRQDDESRGLSSPPPASPAPPASPPATPLPTPPSPQPPGGQPPREAGVPAGGLDLDLDAFRHAPATCTPGSGAARPTTSAARPTATTARPPASAARPPATAARRPASAARPPASAARKPSRKPSSAARTPAPFTPTAPGDDDLPDPIRPCKQDTRLVRRVCQLGREGLPPSAIDRKLSAEGFLNSSGRQWAAKNDGRVVVRILLNHRVAISGTDPKVRQYARDYAAKLNDPSSSRS
ncbi:hypothetical protein T492DRAFT_842187 [Pavlovales sp. CCMP2436]|nr:hypothetical protein T492DRAFT_842187 [Pavlovales sp. CCMP2436]